MWFMDILRTRKNPKSSKDGIKKSTSKLRQNFFEHIFATANSGRPAKICSKAISAAQIFNNFKRDITREKGDTFSPSFTIAQKSKMAVFPKKKHMWSMVILRTRKNSKSSKDGIKKSTSVLRQNFFEHSFV